ncbi:glutamate ligase domain-containing protein [Kitasatospora sp. NPDC057015]|uniref:glutamate ligase domain-containing protein n=1 Tax=Kitasatospora sp. NPDC057015 TaxID=3346001 RepID=UPI00364333B7
MDTTTLRATVAAPTVPELLSAPHLVDVALPAMEGLALWLAERGANVTGSVPPAEHDSPVVAGLRAAGVRVEAGFATEHVHGDRTAVAWSGAVVGAHPELDRARVLRLPMLGRAPALAAVAAHPGRQVVAVGGSHSTATAAAALAAALDDGTTGWILNAVAQGGSAGHGGTGRLVVDFCPDTTTHEAQPPSLWQRHPAPHLDNRISPAVVLITSTGANAPHHLDNVEGLKAAERLARTAATVVLPTWDQGTPILRERLTDRRGPALVTVGLDQGADVRILVPRWTGDAYHLTLRYRGAQHAFVLPIAGRHHALAACAAIATTLVLGEDPQIVAERLAEFRGVERSLATVGTQKGITVVASRARHPHEVADDVTAARLLTEGSVIAVLEPDGFARTTAHAAELGAALRGADHAVLLPISTPLTSVHADDPLNTVEHHAGVALGTDAVRRVRSGPCEPGVEQQIATLAAPGDLVLLIGTGQAATRLGPRLLFHLGAPHSPIPRQL